jgi:hypothetical protein
MRQSEAIKATGNDLKEALPLTDVRGMAKRAQARPPPATPPFQQNRHAFANAGNNNNNNINNNSVRYSGRLPESKSCDEILSADTDDNDDHVSCYVIKSLKCFKQTTMWHSSSTQIT